MDSSQDIKTLKLLPVKEVIIYSIGYGVQLNAFEEGSYLNKFVY